MDLSSLEGPPISDARFTPQARYRQPDTYYPYMDMDTDANDRPSPLSEADRDSKRRNLYCPLRSHRSDNYYSTSSSLQPPLPRPRARSNPYDDTRDYTQSQGQERGRERERRPPTRLIWLDNERTWLRVDSRAVQNPSQPPVQPQRQSQIPSLLLSVPLPHRQHQPPQYRYRHRQSLDLPPSYGNHLGDVMIAAQPGRSASSGYPRDYDDGDDDYDDMEVSYDIPHRRGEGLSRWGAVARRVNGR